MQQLRLLVKNVNYVPRTGTVAPSLVGQRVARILIATSGSNFRVENSNLDYIYQSMGTVLFSWTLFSPLTSHHV